MSEQLFRAARAVVEEMSTSVGSAWQGEGVIAVPIVKLLALEDAVNAPDIARMHCLGCGTALGIGEPVKSSCGRLGCRERHDARPRLQRPEYP